MRVFSVPRSNNQFGSLRLKALFILADSCEPSCMEKFRWRSFIENPTISYAGFLSRSFLPSSTLLPSHRIFRGRRDRATPVRISGFGASWPVREAIRRDRIPRLSHNKRRAGTFLLMNKAIKCLSGASERRKRKQANPIRSSSLRDPQRRTGCSEPSARLREPLT